MGGAFSLGRVFGIQLRLHYTWFIIFVLVTVSLVFPHWRQGLYWIMGIVTSLLFFASVVAHELAHSLIARANGIPIKSITLFIFGGVAQMTREATRPGIEFKMAVAGPGCSLAVGGLFYLLWLAISKITVPAAIMIQWLAYVNFALAAFNLIPGFPLDGGRVFRAILWRVTGNYARSTRVATQVGRGIGYAFMGGGILTAFLPPFGLTWFNGLWLAFIGWFLANAASDSYRQARWREILTGVTVARLMTSDSRTVSPKTTVSQIIQEHILPGGYNYFVVVDEGQLEGILTLRSIKSVPQRDWGLTQAKDIMTPLDRLEPAYPDQDVLAVLEQMDESGISQMPVVSEGRVIGLIDRENLVRFLRTRSELGV